MPASACFLEDDMRGSFGRRHGLRRPDSRRRWPGRRSCWDDGFGGTPALLALTKVVAVAPASTHACVLLDGGAVWCWGDNWAGQLGNGNELDSPAPVPVGDLGDVTAAATGAPTAARVTKTGPSHAGATTSTDSSAPEATSPAPHPSRWQA